MSASVNDAGTSRRATLEQVEKTTGKRPAELDGPECPELLLHIWMDFMHLSRGRTSNGFGANPLTWTDIAEWQRLTRIDLSPWHVDLLVALDNAWMTEHARQLKPKDKAKTKTQS